MTKAQTLLLNRATALVIVAGQVVLAVAASRYFGFQPEATLATFILYRLAFDRAERTDD